MAEKNVKYYKTKDGTVVYCKDEVARQGVEELQGIWEAIEELPDGQAVSAEVAIHTTQIEKLKKGKANINGNYDSMTVGMAKNIEANEIVSGIFKYRPTAGNAEVATGAAKVRSIKGNSVAWGQLVQNGNFANAVTGWTGRNGGGYSVSDNVATLWNQGGDIRQSFDFVVGHKYLLKFDVKSNVVIDTISVFYAGTLNNRLGFGVEQANVWLTKSAILTADNGNNNLIYFSCLADTIVNLRNVQIFDLTLMFGAGNEPSSVAEFEVWLQNNIGLQNYYPTNSGKLLAAKLLGLRTVWLNQWDEEWEIGGIDTSDGSNMSAENTIRCKNYIEVSTDVQYYIKCPTNVVVHWYKANKSQISFESASNRLLTVPNECKYVRFRTYAAYGTTYNHDICINLHYTNGRDGEYEPYEEHNYNFDTSKVYGKLNGEGNYVQIFPDGLKSAGSARDELIINGGDTKAIKRVGSVDLGSLGWATASAEGRCNSNALTDIKPINYSGQIANILCANWSVVTSKQWYRNTMGIALLGVGYGQPDSIGIVDSGLASKTGEQIQSAMNGILLFYELAEYAEYTDLVYRDNGVDTPLLDYFSGVILVDNYGTEEQIIESPTNGAPNACTAGLDILYGVNAADFIDAANNGAFISKDSMDAFLNALGSAMNGSWSSTWDATNGRYSYTFTPNS